MFFFVHIGSFLRILMSVTNPSIFPHSNIITGTHARASFLLPSQQSPSNWTNFDNL